MTGSALIATLLLALMVSLQLTRWAMEREAQASAVSLTMFEGVMDRLRTVWADPAVQVVHFRSAELALLDGRTAMPSIPSQHVLVFGASIDEEPTSMAQQYARLLGFFEEELSAKLHHPVAFDLKLFKGQERAVAAIQSGEIDILSLSAIEYIRALEGAPQLILIAQEANAPQGIVFVGTNTSIHALPDMRGRSMAFGDDNWGIRSLAQAGFVEGGLMPDTLAFYTNYLDRVDYTAMTFGFRSANADEPSAVFHSHRETVFSVLRGDYDGGVTRSQLFYKYRHQGLREIYRFSGLPNVWAGRPQMENRMLEAFREVVFSLKLKNPTLLKQISDEAVVQLVIPEPGFAQRVKQVLDKSEAFLGDAAGG